MLVYCPVGAGNQTLDPLQEQAVLLTVEQSLQSLKYVSQSGFKLGPPSLSPHYITPVPTTTAFAASYSVVPQQKSSEKSLRS